MNKLIEKLEIGMYVLLVCIVILVLSVPILISQDIKRDETVAFLREENERLKEENKNLQIEYKWYLDSCYQRLGDLEDKYEAIKE